jgi:uncharacterized protein (DUF433 family)
MKKKTDIYDGENPLELPAYTLPTAARFVRVPTVTLRSWIVGRNYETAKGTKRALPLIHPPAHGEGYLSFINLVEAHVLASMRKDHEVEMRKCRAAITYVENELAVDHPLARQTFHTDGIDLFVEKFGKLINASAKGQVALRDAIKQGLSRVGYKDGIAARLFPLLRASGDADQPKLVVIDPRIAFGRPVLSGTAIPVEEIAQRFQAGDSSAHLAKEFGLDRDRIDEALRLKILEAA